MNAKFNCYFLIFLSFISSKISLLIYFISKLSPTLYRYFVTNERTLVTIQKNQLQRRIYNKSVVFYCSSAGEYIQILSLISFFHSLNYNIHIFFFSPSGFNFINAKINANSHEENKENNYNFSLSPFDHYQSWLNILEQINPEFVFINRHEMWPSFILAANKIKKPILLNYSDAKKPGIFKKSFLNNFKFIFCVNNKSLSSLPQTYKPKGIIAGDTKFDSTKIEIINSDKMILPPKQKVRFVGGSVWPADLDIILPAIKGYMQDIEVILCPHEVGDLTPILNTLQKHQYNYILHSKHPQNDRLLPNDIRVVDKLGILSKMYAECDLAYVGGGIHHKVHNVLEPAAFDLHISFGPKYSNSPEACIFVQQNAVSVIHSSNDMKIWFENNIHKPKNKILSTIISSNIGATDKIIKHLGLKHG